MHVYIHKTPILNMKHITNTHTHIQVLLNLAIPVDPDTVALWAHLPSAFVPKENSI